MRELRNPSSPAYIQVGGHASLEEHGKSNERDGN